MLRAFVSVAAVLLLVASVIPANAESSSSLPQIWSFQPRIGGEVSPGSIILIDFTSAMEPYGVGVRIDPAADFWWYWDKPDQLVVQAKGSWKANTNYHITVTGRSQDGGNLVGQKEFFFRTSREIQFGTSCAGRSLTYHINGRPGVGEISDNFVDWSTFQLQLDQLQSLGYRFGAPDEACWPGNDRVLSLQFDDGWKTQYIAAQILAKRGIRGFFAVTIEHLDKPGFLTRGELVQISKMGMIIGSHLMRHDCITQTAFGMDPPSRQLYLDWQLQRSQQELRALTGQPINFLVYPHGCFDTTIAREVSKYYWAAWTGTEALPLPGDLQTWYGRQRITVKESTRFR